MQSKRSENRPPNKLIFINIQIVVLTSQFVYLLLFYSVKILNFNSPREIKFL